MITEGRIHGRTVMMADAVAVAAQSLVTSTQYVVVTAGVTATLGVLASGRDLSPISPVNQRNVRLRPALLALIASVTEEPSRMDCDAVTDDTTMAGQPPTVIVAVVLSATGVQAPVTRTQKLVVLVGVTVTAGEFAPAIGLRVSPLDPAYH